jgi:hypothetical protein
MKTLILLIATTITTSATAATTPKSQLLWEAWYTITLSKTVPYGYYSERFELKDGKLFYQSKQWKTEEGFINEEQIGELSEPGPTFTPLFFNMHSSYRNSELTIDGNIKDGKALTVKIRRGTNELPIIKRNLPAKTILSSTFPAWLGFTLPNIKIGKTLSILSLPEDNLEANYTTFTTAVRLEKPDEFAQKTGTNRVTVDYKNQRAIWWIEKSGCPVRIEMPSQHAVVERTTEQKARTFLDE